MHKNIFRVPFSPFVLGLINVLIFSIYYLILYFLYQAISKIININIPYIIAAILISFCIVAICGIILKKIIDKDHYSILRAIAVVILSTIIGIAYGLLYVVWSIFVNLPKSCVDDFLNASGHTAAKEKEEEEEKKRKEREAFAWQKEQERAEKIYLEYLKKQIEEQERQKTLDVLKREFGISKLPSEEEYRHLEREYLKKHHPDNGGTSKDFVEAQQVLESLKLVMSLRDEGKIRDDLTYVG